MRLTGSGPAAPAASDCPCATCRWTATHEPPRAPLALTLPDGRVLGAGTPATAVQVGGSTLLWAPAGTAPETSGTPADLAVLFPAEDDRALTGLAHTLARLRATGAVTPDARVVVAGLGHRHRRPDLLADPLAAWGACRPEDGADLDALAPLPRLAGRTLVLGGASSGKSAYAESLLAAEPDVTYLATGPDPDTEDAAWAARIRAHRERRPAHWSTIETPHAASAFDDPRAVLLDSVGAWLAAALDGVGAWRQAPGWRDRLAERVAELVGAWRSRTRPLVAVSDEVGWGVVPDTPAGRLFREELGDLNARLAEESDRVVLLIAGRAAAIMSP